MQQRSVGARKLQLNTIFDCDRTQMNIEPIFQAMLNTIVEGLHLVDGDMVIRAVGSAQCDLAAFWKMYDNPKGLGAFNHVKEKILNVVAPTGCRPFFAKFLLQCKHPRRNTS